MTGPRERSIVERITRVVVRSLADPSYAMAVAENPFRVLSGSELPRPLLRRLGDVPPDAWTPMARRFGVVTGPDRTPCGAPPAPGEIGPGPVLANGRVLSAGRKYRVGLGHRTVPFGETLRRAERVEQTVGITRIANTTGVDRVGIPVWTAIRPDNSNTISVFNGKGPTDAQARAGAYMEAIERHAAEFRPSDSRVETTARMRRAGPLVTPADLRLVPSETFDVHERIEWTRAWDVLNEEHVWVPTAATTLPYRPLPGARPFRSSSNGLASGNTVEEAICHGLAERIERDSQTLVAVRGYLVPLARAVARTILGDLPVRRVRVGRFPEHVDLSTVPADVHSLVDRFRAADLQISVLDITSDLGIPAFQAVAVDPHLNNDVIATSLGVGAHPTAEIALQRAVTEAAQSRVTFIQGAREDIPTLQTERYLQPMYPVAEEGSRKWKDVPSAPTPAVRDDICLMLAALRRAGVSRCLVKELTRPDVGIPVVMVVVPELETWAASVMHDHPTALGERALGTV